MKIFAKNLTEGMGERLDLIDSETKELAICLDIHSRIGEFDEFFDEEFKEFTVLEKKYKASEVLKLMDFKYYITLKDEYYESLAEDIVEEFEKDNNKVLRINNIEYYMYKEE